MLQTFPETPADGRPRTDRHAAAVGAKRRFLSALTVAMLALMPAMRADATNLFDPTIAGSDTLDDTAVRLDGTLHDTTNSRPWTAKVYAGTGECLRLFVISTLFDAKISVISPSGTVYRDDDSGGSLRPLVRVNNTRAGWYVVQVAHYRGLPQNANFTLLYGRYPAFNTNCEVPTSPARASAGFRVAVTDTSPAEQAVHNPDAP